MGAQRPPLTLHQNLEIPSCLSRLDDAECIFLVRHWQIEGVVAGDLQEHARVRATLVGLSG